MFGQDVRECQFWYHLTYKQKEESLIPGPFVSVEALMLILFPIYEFSYVLLRAELCPFKFHMWKS